MKNQPAQTVVPWLTPKIFDDLDHPKPAIEAYFDHYQEWFSQVDEIVLAFCAGNGDHILNYPGKGHDNETFDWARYSAYVGGPENRRAHNQQWVTRCREGGEVSGNPYLAGPSFILSDQPMTYARLTGIYQAIREVAKQRDLNLKLLEYLEPGSEFCDCIWKTQRHPEAAGAPTDCGGTELPGLIDVCGKLNADQHTYASHPNGIPADLLAGDFVAAQSGAYTRDFAIDGILLGNQFGLINLWHPEDAVKPTPERREGIKRFFHQMREQMNESLIYWMDSYWPVETEIDAWGMSQENYQCLDGVLISNFAVIVERTQMRDNIQSKIDLSKQGGPKAIFSLDFFDPWYGPRLYLDDKINIDFQHKVYRELGSQCDGTTFFSNDNFGLLVPPAPLTDVMNVLKETLDWSSNL